MTEEELSAIEARVEKATPGPWEGRDGCVVAPEYIVTEGVFEVVDSFRSGFEHNAAFIAASRQDVPALCAELRRVREFLAADAQRLLSIQFAFNAGDSRRDELRIQAAKIEAFLRWDKP